MRSFLCGVAARMKASVLPRRCRPMPDQLPTLKHRHVDLVPLRLAAAKGAAVEIVAQPEMQRVDLPAVRHLLRGAPQQMMQQMRGVPIGHEQTEQPAVVERIAIEIGKALPGNDRLQRRRLQIGGEPLIDREIGNAEQPDIAVAPRLRRRPFDGVVEIDRFGQRPRLALAGRFAGAAAVDAHGGIAARHPPFRIDGLPIHPFVRRFGQRIRHDPELVLLIRTEIEDGGKFAFVVRPEHVRLQPRAVAHRHVDVFVDDDGIVGIGRLVAHGDKPFVIPGRASARSPESIITIIGGGTTAQDSAVQRIWISGSRLWRAPE